MVKMNTNYEQLQGSYLFAEVNKRVKEYQAKNPDKRIIRLGIGDVTEPLTPAVIHGLENAVKEMSKRETFQGYPPYEGYEFLRNIIQKSDFASRNIAISPEEIFVTTGAKEDTGNFQELFSTDMKLAITDPVYPVYVDSNVMAGRAGTFINGQYDRVVYLPCNAENNFTPSLPKEHVDLIYLCFPNNPTGQVLNKHELKKWVDYAREHEAIILYDAAYEAFIREEDVPHSIFEIEGAKEVAVEFRSLSKTAGFTGTRCGYTIIPNELMVIDSQGKKQSLNKLWLRRQSTKFNGVAYIIQKGAYEVFTDAGKKEAQAVIDYYLGNAQIIAKGVSSMGLSFTGGINSPYIWMQTPGKMSSWDFFDALLNQVQVVGTPGSGFGKSGEGYFRLTSFGKREDVIEAVDRFKKLKV